MDAETGWYNFGARYLNPKTGMWLSSDPALGEYIPRAPLTKDDKEANGNLPGNGGIYNPINFALYHFAGNNPIRYTDPDGRILTIDGTDEYKAEINSLLDTAAKADPAFAKKLDEIKENKDITVTITSPGSNKEPSTSPTDRKSLGEHKPSGSIVRFDPNLKRNDPFTGKALPPVSSLAHEIGHAYRNMSGRFDGKSNVIATRADGSPFVLYNRASESEAINTENGVLIGLGLDNLYRDSYGGLPVDLKSKSELREERR